MNSRKAIDILSSDPHREVSENPYSSDEVSGNFSGLGANDSGGAGFKTISLNGILVSNATSLDGTKVYHSSGSNNPTFIVKVDPNVYTSINLIEFNISSFSSQAYPDVKVTFKDSNGDVIKEMSDLEDGQDLGTTLTSISSYFTVNNSLPIANVASIEFSGFTGQNFQLENFTFIPITNTAPTATDVSVSGEYELNEQLTGGYDYADDDNDDESGSTFKWYRSNDDGGSGKTEIAGATSSTYTLTSEDVDKYISFEVTPNDGTEAGTAVESSLNRVYYEISSNNAIHLDGDDDYIAIGDDEDFDFSNGLTAEAWIKPDVLKTAVILSQFSDGERAFSLLLKSDGKLEASISRNGSSEDYFVTSATVSAGEWTHVAMTYDGSTLRIFINGTEDSNNEPVSGTIFDSDEDVVIGSRQLGLYFDGTIDEVRLWGRARSQSEISASMNCRVSAGYSNLIAYYDFNQGTTGGSNSGITSILDRSANGLNASPSNMGLSGSNSNFLVGAQGGNFEEVLCNNPPTASNLSVSGTYEVGEQLTTNYDYADDDNDTETGSIIQWYRSNDNSGAGKAAINGATNTTYTLTNADASKYISFEVRPNDGTETGTAVESTPEYVFYEISDRNSLHFDGVDDRVEIADDAAFDFSNGFTAQMWVRPEEIATSGIISQYSNADKAFSVVLTSSGNLEFTMTTDGSSDQYFETTGTLNVNEWAHIAFTYDGSIMKAYINGVEDATSETVSGTMHNSSAEIEVASRDGAYHYKGRIDELSFIGRALSGSEISRDMNCKVSLGTTNLIAAYDFDQGTTGADNTVITSLTDRSGNDLHGTISALSLNSIGSNFVSGAQEGTFTGQVCNAVPAASNVAFSGTLEVDEVLTGTYDYADDENDAESGTTFKWYRSNDANGTNKTAIDGATSSTYTLTLAEATKFISFEVTPNDGNSAGIAVESALQGPLPSYGPEVLNIVRQAPSTETTGSTTVVFRVTFSDEVTNVDVSDFVLNSTVNGTVSSVSLVSTDVYDVTVSGLDNAVGTVSLGIKGVDSESGSNDIATFTTNESLETNYNGSGDYLNQASIGQTFTAATSNRLSKITIYPKSGDHNFSGTATLSFYNGDQTAGGTLMLSQTVNISSSTDAGGQSFTIPALPALTQGNTYSFLFSNFSGSGSHALIASDNGGFANGHVIFTGMNNTSHLTDLDLAFQIYESAVTTLVGLASTAPVTSESYTKEGFERAPFGEWPGAFVLEGGSGVFDDGDNHAGLNVQVPDAHDKRLPGFAVGDLDADGDMDFLVGSFSGKVYPMRNTGTATSPNWEFVTGWIPTIDTLDTRAGNDTELARPVLVDIDDDGDLDLFIGNQRGWDADEADLHDVTAAAMNDVVFFRNVGDIGNPVFEFQEIEGLFTDPDNGTEWFHTNYGSFAAPSFADLDGDDDLDMIVMGNDTISYAENIGTKSAPEFLRKYRADSPFEDFSPVTNNSGSTLSEPNFVDIDNDGDLDLISGTTNGFFQVILNSGTANAPEFLNANKSNTYLPDVLKTFDVGAHSTGRLADLNGDGVLDFIVGNLGDGNIGNLGWFSGVSNDPTMVSAVKTNNTTITITYSENVQTNGGNPTDFRVTDCRGNTYEVTAQTDGTAGDTDIVLTVASLEFAVGDITITYANNNAEITDSNGVEQETDETGVVISAGADETAPVMSSATKDSATEIIVTFSENVAVLGTNSDDFTVIDGAGDPYTVSAITDGTQGEAEVTLTVADLSGALGDLTITYTNNNNEIVDFACNGLDTDATGVTIDLDNTAPTLISATKDSDTQITLTFSEEVQIDGADANNFVITDGDNNNFCVLSLTDGTAEDNQLVLGFDDLSSAVERLTITYDPSSGNVSDFGGNNLAADATGVVITLNQAPTVSNVSITGAIVEGNELTGNYDYADDENDDEDGTAFKWYRADAANGTNIETIAGATNSTYTLVEEDHEKYLFFEVTPSDGNSNGVATRSGATYVKYPRITSVSIPQVPVNVDDAVTVTIQANQAGLSLQSGIINGVAVTGFSDEGNGTYTAIYTLKEDHTNRFSNDDIPVSFTLVEDNGGVSNTYNDAISQIGDALRVLDITSAPNVAYQNFEDDGDDWNYTEASETYDLSNVRTYFEVMPQHRDSEGNITSTDGRGPYIIYPEIVDDLVATYDYNSADAPASFNTVTGTSIFTPQASTLQDRLNFGIFMKDRLPYIYFLFDNAQEDPNFRLGGEAAFNVTQEAPWNGYNPIVFFEDQETVGDNANIDFADSLAYYADQGVLRTSFKWAPEANDGMIYGPVVNNVTIDLDSTTIDNRYALYGHLDTFDGTLRPHKTRTDSNEDSELSFELKQSGSAVLVNNPDDGEDIVASTNSLNSPANGSNFLDFYNESGVDIATTRTYTFDAVDLTAGDEKLLSFSYYAKNLSYPDSLFIQVSYNETPDWDAADEEVFLTESRASWTDFEMRIPSDKESIALRIVSKTDDEDDKVSFDHFRVVQLVDETAPTVAITSDATDPQSGAFTATFTFSEDVSGFDVNDISVGNGEASNLNTTSAAVYTATITPASDGEVTVDVAADAAEDWIGNANTVATQLSVINDETAPTLVSATKDSEIQITLTFSEEVQIDGADASNFTVEDGNNDSFCVLSLTDGTAQDNKLILGFDDLSSAVGRITITYDPSSGNVSDFAGNNLAADATGVEIILDVTAPSGYSVSLDDELLNATEAANATFTFAGAEVGATYNYTVSSDGGGTDVTGSGTITTATDQINLADLSGLNDGELTLSVKLTDPASNEGVAVTDNTNLDATAPSAPTVGAIDTDRGPSNSDFITNDQSLVIGGLAEANSSVEVFIDDTSVGTTTTNGQGTYLLDYTGTDLSEGDYSITAKATDAASNTSSASTAQDVTINLTVPTVNITSNASDPQSGAFTATFTFSEDISGFDVNDITVGNGTASNFNTTSAKIYTATITPSADGEVTVDVLANKATDIAGNSNSVATQLSVINDETAPEAPIVAGISTDAGSSATDGITNDQTLEINGTAEANASVEVFIGGNSIGNTTADGSGDWTFDHTGSTLIEAAHSITAKATDVAGNVSVVSSELEITIDTTTPSRNTGSIVGKTYGLGQNMDITVEFDEVVLVETSGGTPTINIAMGGQSRAASYLSGSGTTTLTFRYTTVSGDFDGNGVSLSAIQLNGGTIADAAGNDAKLTGTFSGAADVRVDTVIPSLTITSNSSQISGAFTATFTFNEDVSGFDVSDISVGNGSASSFNTTSSKIYTATITPSADGNVTVNVAADKAQDAGGNGNTAASELRVVNDETAPTVTITSSVDPTSGAFTATFTFSEDVSGFDVNDITVGNGAASNFNTTSASVYTATITPSADGEVTVDVSSAVAQDAAGNNNTAAIQLSVTNDETAPTVLEVTSDVSDRTFKVGDDINIYVQYSEEVFVTGTPQLELETGTTDRIINYVDRSSSTLKFVYTVQAGDVSSDLDVTSATALSLNGGTIIDAVDINADLDVPQGTAGGALTSKNIVIDGIAPTITITSNATDPQSGAFTATFTFSEDVSGFDVNDITVGNGVASNFNTTSAKIFTATITPSADGEVTIDVAADVVQDVAGNNNEAATQLSVTNDETGPTVTVTSSVYPTSGAFTATFTFNEDVSNFASTDITVANALLSNFATTSAKIYTATITPQTDGEVTVDVAADVAQDAAGNNNTAATQLSVTNDETAPTLVSGVKNSDTEVTLTFSEPVQTQGANPTDFTVTDGNSSTFTVQTITDGTVGDDELILTFSDLSSAQLNLNIVYANNNAEVTDLAGNDLASSRGGINISLNAVPTATNVDFSGTLTVGETLTGSYTYTDSDNDTESGTTFKWYRSDDANGTNKTAIAGATTSTYDLTSADADKYISFEVTPHDGNNAGTAVESNLQGAVSKISQAITFTALADKTYGDASFTLAATASSNLGVTYTSSNTSVATVTGSTVSIVGAGTATITASQAGDASYAAATDATQGLTVNKAVLTATAEDKSKTYGEANPTFTVSYTGFVNGEDETAITTEPTASTATDATTGVGNYDIDLAGGAANNYSFSLTSGTLTIGKATITAIAEDKSKTYGEANPTFTITYNGFVNGEDETVITTEPIASTVADATSGVGNYDIDLAGGAADNYSFNLNSGTLTIGKATITATADDKSKVYGESNPDFTVTYDGFVNGDDATAITTEPTASTVADATTGVGTYDIDLAGGIADNYNFSLNSGTLTIGKAVLTATAEDKSKTYGEVNPSFTIAYTGFVNGDDETTITIEPTASTVADATTGVGNYDIDLAGGAANNYSFSLTSGTLTIGKATITAIAEDKSKTYGEANPTFTITYNGFVNGDDETAITTEPIASTVADATTGVGNYDIDLAGGAADNYSFNLTSGTLTVNKAVLTVTADDKLKGFGQVNPELTMIYAGFVNGDDVSDIDVEPSISTAADETTPAGTVAITLVGGSDDNYSLNLIDGTMTIVDASIITSVAVPADGTYKIGEELEFTATFSLPITITGTPSIPLTIGTEVKAAVLAGSVTNGSTATFSYTVVEGDLDTDGIALGTNIDLNGGTIVDGFGTDASLTLTNAGSTALVNVDGVRPSAPVVTSVSDDSGFDGSDGITFDQTLMISGTAEANILVEVFIDGTSIGTTTSDANGDWTFDNTANTLEGGYYTITAKTTDAVGNTSDASADYVVEIDIVSPAPPPAPTIDPTSDLGVSNSDNLTSDKTPTIVGTAEANASIEITSDKDGVLGTTTADANGDWAFTPTGDLSEGSHEVTVKATDAAGNQGGASDPLIKELDFTLELVSFSPADNAIDVLPSTDLTIDFGENVNKGTGSIIIKRSSDNTVLETIDVTSDEVSISGSVVTINPENEILPQATEFYVMLDAGTFTDNSGNAHAGISNNTNWTFTTIDAAVVTSVGIPNDGTYGIGDEIAIELTFSQTVTMTGAPTIDLTIGTQTVAATLQGTVSASTTATFAYTVEEGDLDVDGISVGSTINLNGGTLKDAFDVDAITALADIGSTANINVDGVRATPTLSTSAGDLTNASFTVTVTYDEPVSGLTADDLDITNGTADNVTVVTAGTVWTADITPTADGTTTVSVLAGAVADAAGNTSVGSTKSITTTYDGTAPEVSSIARAEADQLNNADTEANFTVTFSEAVTGVDVSDFATVTTGTATGSINTVTATSATTYTVNVNGISGQGTVGLNLTADNSILDAAMNSLTADFTGAVYTINWIPTAITMSSTSIAENAAIGTAVGTLTTTDQNAADSHSYTLVAGTGDADNASFTISADQLLTAEVFDFETKNSYSIRVMTDDGNGGTFEQALTITVDNELEASIIVTGEETFEETILGFTTTNTWTVTNDGEVDVEVRISNAATDFSVNPSSVVIAAGASQEVAVSFMPQQATDYAGTITFDYDGGSVSKSVSGSGVIVTDIDDQLMDEATISIYPNPASTVVTLDLTELYGLPVDVSIYSTTGQPMFNREEVTESKLQINVGSYESGVYIVRFSNGNSVVNKKVMIKR